jgi:hypothetical protein
MRTAPAQITIRLAEAADGPALTVLAALDSAAPLTEPVLIGESDGKARAALSLSDGRAIADPFHATAHLVELLRVHATQIDVDQESVNRNGHRRWLPKAPLPSPLRAS